MSPIDSIFVEKKKPPPRGIYHLFEANRSSVNNSVNMILQRDIRQHHAVSHWVWAQCEEICRIYLLHINMVNNKALLVFLRFLGTTRRRGWESERMNHHSNNSSVSPFNWFHSAIYMYLKWVTFDGKMLWLWSFRVNWTNRRYFVYLKSKSKCNYTTCFSRVSVNNKIYCDLIL